MAKRHFQLTEHQDHELLAAYSQCVDGPTRTRYQAVRMYGRGYALAEILALTGSSRTAVMEWCHFYQTDGLESLTDQRRGGNAAKLSPTQQADLRARLQQYTPAMIFGPQAAGDFWNVPDLKRALLKWYAVEYASPTSYLNQLARCGLTYQRPAKVYKSQKPVHHADFEEQLEKN